MTLTVLTPAEDTKLTTAAAVRAQYADATDDALLDVLIQTASDQVAAHCHRVFAQEQVKETLPGYGDMRLMLTRTPLVSVSEVLYANSPLVDWSIEDAAAGLLYRQLGWSWTAVLGWGVAQYVIPRSEQPLFSVTYVGGYQLPGWASGEAPALPGGVEQACIETVIDLYQHRADDQRVKSRTVGDTAVTYAEATRLALLPSAIDRLEPWVRYF